MIDADAAQTDVNARRAHHKVDFAKPMTKEIRESVTQEYARLFWQREATPMETATLLDLMHDVETAGSASVKTADVLTFACTAAATSLSAITD